MGPELGDSRWWLVLAALTYAGGLALAWRCEKDFRTEFAQSQTSLRSFAWDATCGLAILAAVIWLSHNRLPLMTAVAFALAAAVLVGIYRIDRLLLLIPDRLQLAGALAGTVYLGILVSSGEEWRQLGLTTGFGLVMVLLMWLLSWIYLRVRGSIGFGFGDVKLLGWLALFTGQRTPNLIMLAIGFGFFSLILSTTKHSLATRRLQLPRGQDAFAFGPAIVQAAASEVLLHYWT